MFKTLLKKEFRQNTHFLFLNKKNGKKRSTAGTLLYALLFLYLLVFFGGLFYTMGAALCPPIVKAGQTWLYFTIMGGMSIFVGLFGSIFTVYSSLYQGKDNELLFSLPIPPHCILLSRLFSSYVFGLVFSAFVFFPALAAYWTTVPVTWMSAICSFLLFFVLGLLTLSLSCILGWIVALVASRVKNKSLMTVVVSLALMGIYFYCINRGQQLLNTLTGHLDTIGEDIRRYLYPFYQMGLAFEGKVLSMLIFTLMVLALSGLLLWLLSRSLLTLATTHKSPAKKIYREKGHNLQSAPNALLFKEWKLLLNNPTYLLNAGLGSFFSIAAAVVLIVKADVAAGVFSDLCTPGYLALYLALAIAYIGCMNMLTASSVSMEGKQYWIARSLPIPTWNILRAKINLHLVFSLLPMLILWAVSCIVLHIPLPAALLTMLFDGLFVLFSACLGLKTNLRHPNLNWTNPTAAVKENFSSMLAMLAEMGLLFLFFIAILIIQTAGLSIHTYLVLSIGCLLFALLDALEIRWLKRKGCLKFESL